MESLTNLTAFSNPEFGMIRTTEIDGEPWLVGRDVARILGYANPNDALAKHVDEEDKGVAKCDTPGGVQELTVINESGLYSLVLSSKLSNAKQFKHWITADVIPSIRKHGAYATPATIENIINNPDFGIRLLQSLKEEQEKNKALASENEQMKPGALFASAVSASETSILVRDFSKILRQNGADYGEKRLYKWLRKHGYILQNSTEPSQRAMEQGLFERIERTVQRGDLPPIVKSTTKITGKGQVYFTKILSEEGAER